MTRGRAGVLAALFLSAIALRPQIVGIGPLLPEIESDLDISHAAAGLLVTIPVLCMGLFAPPAPYLSGRLGSRYAIAACLALIGVAGVARALAPGAVSVILLTFPVGVGIGLAGALMPVAVKERFPDRPAFATGMYTTGINAGAAISASLAVPIADDAGGWRSALLVFSVATVGLLGLWLYQTRWERPYARSASRPLRLPLRSKVAWTLVLIFALLGIGYYGLSAWLPDSYVERGWSEAGAGELLAVLNIASIPAGFLVGFAADRIGSRRLYFMGACALMLGSLLGVVLLPGGAWLWAALIGASNGALFALVMTLPLDVSSDAAQVGAVAGMMLGGGYLIASLSPFALGAVRDATGSFTGTLWVMVGTASLLLLLCSTLTPERLRRGVAVEQAASF